MDKYPDYAPVTLESIFESLRSSKAGLSSLEAERRLQTLGYNEFAKRKKPNLVVDFILRFKNPLVIILLAAGAISGFFGQLLDAGIIFSIVFLSVILDFYQEFKAGKAAELLNQKVKTTATVLRDGVKKEIRLAEIVPGDIVFLHAGDIVPADCRIIEAKDLFADESALTGESFPAEKNSESTKPNAEISEASVFMGTSIVSGTATAIVVNTGNNTEFGKIAKKLVSREPETEFEKGLKGFGFLIMKVTVFLVVFIFLVNAFLKQNPLEALLFSVALAVGLTPELLPMVLSITLSKGAISMSKKGVIVKRLNSIENFGSMDVLCTDKTGTLTENKITLVLHVDIEGKNNDKVLQYSFCQQLSPVWNFKPFG